MRRLRARVDPGELDLDTFEHAADRARSGAATATELGEALSLWRGVAASRRVSGWRPERARAPRRATGLRARRANRSRSRLGPTWRARRGARGAPCGAPVPRTPARAADRRPLPRGSPGRRPRGLRARRDGRSSTTSVSSRGRSFRSSSRRILRQDPISIRRRRSGAARRRSADTADAPRRPRARARGRRRPPAVARGASADAHRNRRLRQDAGRARRRGGAGRRLRGRCALRRPRAPPAAGARDRSPRSRPRRLEPARSRCSRRSSRPSATARLLLVTDNFEHVLAAAPAVAELLARRPRAERARDEPHAAPPCGRAGVSDPAARAAVAREDVRPRRARPERGRCALHRAGPGGAAGLRGDE